MEIEQEKEEQGKQKAYLPNFINQNEIYFVESDDDEIEENNKKWIIFDIKNYNNFIDETTFVKALYPFPEDRIDSYFFYDTNKFSEFHFKNYKYLIFKDCNLNIVDLKEFCQTEQSCKIMEIYSPGGVGLSTYLYITFCNLRKKENINFIYFDLKIIENITKIIDIMKYIYFISMNLFSNFQDYNNFCRELFFYLTDKKVVEIGKIIIIIIQKYIQFIKKAHNKSNPFCIIIDSYMDKTNHLYKKITEIQNKYYFKLLFTFLLDDGSANLKILESMIKDNIKETIIFFDNLYKYIYLVPNKYQKIFKNFFPSIKNYLKINECNTEEEASNIYKQEMNNIKEEIFKFYNNNELTIQTYMSAIFLLIDKDIFLNNEFNRNIFLNIPLNYFKIERIRTKTIKIKYNSSIVKKIWKKLCKEIIINALFNFDNIKFDNFIKGGIFEEGIKQIILKGNSFFGKIEKKIKFNCILDFFKKNKVYDFTYSELEKILSSSKIINKLKNKYTNFNFINNFVINQKQNGKDWDMAYICKNNLNEIILFLIQISINKTINDIKIILEYLNKKIKVIKQKIYKILGVKINKVHILFIFKTSIDNEVTYFCSKYNIPYIFYDYSKKDFFDNNFEYIDYNDLLIRTSYENNYFKWKSALSYEPKKIKTKKKLDEKNNDNSDSDSSDFSYEKSNLDVNDIIINYN